MTTIHALSRTFSQMRTWFQPIGRDGVTVHQRGWTRKAFYVALIACAATGPSLQPPAWSAELSPTGNPKTVVVAGVGYENAETSTITVKTYDAENGTILYEETYELNVRDDAAAAGIQPPERIFAGGVGPGTNGLSAFPLRAYDAVTGRFLWEGLLNLNVGNQEPGSTHRVVDHLVAPQGAVTQIHRRGVVDVQPQFLLRAVDSVSGRLVWADHFSAGVDSLAQAERISRAIIGQTRGEAALSPKIEFRIRMMDDQDRRIIWEDTIEPIVEETDVVAEHDDAAEILPAWRGAGSEKTGKEAI